VALAREGNHTAFMESNLRRIYSERYYRKNKWMVPILGKLTKPASYDAFFIQADACLAHNTTDFLNAIAASALVIGGERDLTLGGEPSRRIAGAIPNARLKMYPQWGHGLYEEAKDFNRIVLDFLID
jgi:pimeloyl-ACP methyl ester carboxylesterase